MFKHGMPRRAVAAGVAAASMGAALVAGALPGTAGAAGDDPSMEHVDGNPTCQDLGFTFGFKIDQQPAHGTYSIGTAGTETSGDPAEFTVTISYTGGAEQEFDFEAGPPAVGAVIVKAGPGANVYTFDPAVNAGSGLKSPVADSISHVDFCWSEGDMPGDTTTVPGDTTTVPGEVTTTVPGDQDDDGDDEDDGEMPPGTAPAAVPVPAEPSFTG